MDIEVKEKPGKVPCPHSSVARKKRSVLSVKLERRVMRTFEIGDIVEIGSLDGWLEVTGVIHDEERLFVSIGPDWTEQKFKFGDVVAQYRRIDA